jgi:hypothetical protein
MAFDCSPAAQQTYFWCIQQVRDRKYLAWPVLKETFARCENGNVMTLLMESRSVNQANRTGYNACVDPISAPVHFFRPTMAMFTPSHRTGWLRFWCVLFVCSLLISCSALRLTYSMADWILLWKLDSYFDLSASQKKPLSRQIKTLHAWHRHHELPRYIQFLEQVDKAWSDGLTQAELDSLFASVVRFREHLARQTSLPGAVFLSTVTPAQIRHLQDVMNQEHQRLISDIGQEAGERLTTRTTATLQTLRSWLGKLSVDQETQIRNWIEDVPDISDAWLAHRRNRQDTLLKLLRSSPDRQTLEHDLHHWLADPQTGATDEYLAAVNEWRQHVERVVLNTDHILTREQRRHFSRKLQQMIQDITKLVG